MIKIGICDDEVIYRTYLEEYCRSFIDHCDMDLELHLFCSAKELIQEKDLDILFLDIELDDGNGIQIKEQYQRNKIHTKIVFITTHAEVMAEAFGKNVYAFLEKPIEKDDVCFILQKMIQEIEEEEEYILVDDSNKVKKIYLRQIMYIKADGKFSTIVLEDSRVFSSKNIAYWDEELNDRSFVRTHRSYLANLRNIHKVTKEVILINQERIKMSRYYEKAVKDIYHQYLIRKAMEI